MRDLIISDTSCLIALSRIDGFSILHKLYGTVTITPEVQMEFGEPLPDWVLVQAAPETTVAQIENQYDLDLGETASIALALNEPESVLVIDEASGRRVAKSLGLKTTGTLGILLKAKQTQIIEAITPYILRLHKHDFRMSEQLFTDVLRAAGEPFDYTKWRHILFEDMTVREISDLAMQQRKDETIVDSQNQAGN